MQHHVFWVVFVAYLTFFNKCETKQLQDENGNTYISSGIHPKIKPPILVYLEPNQNDRSSKEHESIKDDLSQRLRSIGENAEDLKQLLLSMDENPEELKQLFRSMEETIPNDVQEEDEFAEDDDDNNLEISRNNERAYFLYHLLRTTIEEADIDPVTVQQLQPAKEFLRNAFIGRCRKFSKCWKDCPVMSKPIKIVCTIQCKQVFDDLDECDPPKKGHTMPPKWLL